MLADLVNILRCGGGVCEYGCERTRQSCFRNFKTGLLPKRFPDQLVQPRDTAIAKVCSCFGAVSTDFVNILRCGGGVCEYGCERTRQSCFHMFKTGLLPKRFPDQLVQPRDTAIAKVCSCFVSFVSLLISVSLSVFVFVFVSLSVCLSVSLSLSHCLSQQFAFGKVGQLEDTSLPMLGPQFR